MDGITLGLVGFIVLFILIMARMPVGAALALVGAWGFASIVGWKSTLDMLQMMPFTTFASQAMSFWVMLCMLLALCFISGMARGFFRSLVCWIPGWRVGPALATLLTTMFFSTLSLYGPVGSRQAAGLVYPAMRRNGYSDKFITGVVSAGLSVGLLLPLGFSFIVYAVITEQSVARMFFACLTPLALSLVTYILIVIFYGRKLSDGLRGMIPGTEETKWAAFKDSWDIWLIVIIMFGGVFSGLLSRTEVVALCVLAALIFTILRRKMTLQNYAEVCKQTLVNSGWFFMLMLGTMLFGYFLTLTRLPYAASEFFYRLELSPYIILAAVLLLLILAGIFLDAVVTLLLLIPLLYPMVMKSGIDPVWFGFLAVRCIGMGISLPGMGIALRRACRASGADARAVRWAGAPFFAADMVLLILMILFPQIVTALPDAVYGA